MAKMGVWALTKFCNEAPGACRSVDLTQLSRQQVAAGKPCLKLIIDGIGFFHTLFEQACPGWEWMLGGNYPALASALEHYLNRLRLGGVELVITLDPAHGTQEDDKKEGELLRRFHQRCATIGGAMELLHSGTQLHVEGAQHKIDWQMPQLCTTQAVRTLRKQGVQMITCQQEADALLVCILNNTPGGYAVAGQDSDFFLMRGLRYLPLEFLSVKGEGGAVQVTGKMFTAETVAAALQLPVGRLFELAWLVGNDHSSNLLDEYNMAAELNIATVSTKNKGSRSLPKDVAAFLLQLPQDTPLSQEPRFLALDTSHELSKSLEECRLFYSGTLTEEEQGGGGACGDVRKKEGERSALDKMLCKGLRDTLLPSWVLAVHRRHLYVSSVKTESMYPDCESEIDATLRPLRRALYSLLVGRGDAVAEGGIGGGGGDGDGARACGSRTQASGCGSDTW